MHEELLVAGFQAVKDKHGAEIKALFDVEVTVPTVPFPRIPLAEAKQIVAERGYEVPRADDDMDPEGERQIAAYVQGDVRSRVRLPDRLRLEHPAVLPHASRGRPALTNSYDLIFNGAEISTGAQREHRIDVLEEQVREKGLEPEELASTSTSSATASRRTAASAWASRACSCSCCTSRTSAR